MVTGTMIAVVILVFITFALLFGLNALNAPAQLPTSSASVINETGYLNYTGYALQGLNNASTPGATGFVITQVRNSTNAIIAPANYTIIGNVVYNLTSVQVGFGNATNFTYTYGYLSPSGLALTALQANTTQLTQNVSNQLPTAGTIFGIVLLLAVLGILILMIVRWKQHSSVGGGSL